MADTAATRLDAARLRADFPILSRTVYDGKPLVYLDNAATTQKPQAVLDRLAAYYANENANVHRGVHHLSAEGTEAYEEARRTVQRFLGAPHAHEVVFTRGTTEAINLVAHGFTSRLGEGDEVVVSALEHHANIVPWQMLCERTGATLRVIPVLDTGDLDLSRLDEIVTEAAKVVAVTHTSNALGTVVDLWPIVEAARSVGAAVLVDGAQAAPHAPVDVQALGADFFVFSGHKTFGPTGIGALWGREAWLEKLPPYQGGGDMIDRVTFEGTTYAGLPAKFEAGTPHVAGGIGLGAALDYLLGLGMDAVAATEADLLATAERRLEEVEGLRFVGTPRRRAGAISFLLDGIHPYDAGTVLDRLGVAVRTGHHCAQPIMDRFAVPGTVRASFALYNTEADVDALVEGLDTVQSLFG
ncbi:MAG: cysteine desulfurase [Bacteroidota bacterium]